MHGIETKTARITQENSMRVYVRGKDRKWALFTKW